MLGKSTVQIVGVSHVSFTVRICNNINKVSHAIFGTGSWTAVTKRLWRLKFESVSRRINCHLRYFKFASLGWLPKCNNLRALLPKTYDTKPLFYRLKLPYFIQLDDKFQTIVFDAKQTGLNGRRIISKRQLRDSIRAERKFQYFNEKVNVVNEARTYADIVNQNPHMTKTQIANRLGFSRIHLYRMINILNLAPQILDFIQTCDSTHQRELLTERRLRPICSVRSSNDQLTQFRKIVELGISKDV